MKRSTLWIGVLLATLLAHAPTLGGGFVYDDHRFVTHNEALRSVAPLDYVLDPGTASHGEGVVADIYRPVRTLLFSLEWAAFGVEPLGWHVVSLVLHLVGTFLAFRLLLGLLPRAQEVAALGALLYGVHPLTTETVAWVSSQGDLLAMAGMLGALVLLERPGRLRAVGGAALHFGACLAKESALVLPALLLLRDPALPRNDPARPTPWARTTLARVGLLAVVDLAYLVLRTSVLPGLAQTGHPEGTWTASARGMLAGLWFYLRGLLGLAGFTFDQRFEVPPSFGDPEVVLGLGVLLSVLAAGAYALWRGRPLLAFATLGALAALLPASNVFVPLKTFVADRFLVPALPAIVAGVAGALALVPAGRRTVALSLPLAAALVLAVATHRQAGPWRDDESLWTAVRDDRPSNPSAYYGIARAQLERGDLVPAELGYRTYLEFNPLDGKAALELGDALGEGALAMGDSVAGGDTTGLRDQRRRVLRGAQVEAYRHAHDVWGQVGLEAGRGSPALRRAMLERWIGAALDLGDLLQAARVHDFLLEADGLPPGDGDRVMREGSWHHRRMRAVLAWEAWRRPTDSLRPTERLAWERFVATRLEAAALDSGGGHREVLRRFAALLEALIDEREREGRDPEEGLYLAASSARLALQDRAAALEMLVRARRRHPHSAMLARAHAQVAGEPR
jgi:hypothetical protein